MYDYSCMYVFTNAMMQCYYICRIFKDFEESGGCYTIFYRSISRGIESEYFIFPGFVAADTDTDTKSLLLSGFLVCESDRILLKGTSAGLCCQRTGDVSNIWLACER